MMKSYNFFGGFNAIFVRLVPAILGLLFSCSLYAAELPTLDFGGDFTLTDHNNNTASLSDYKGKVVVISFGFTHCPDVCPSTLVRLKNMLSKLGDDADQLQTLFISIDPENDSPETLKTYLAYFDPSFIGLTGTLEELKAVAAQYHGGFIKRDTKIDDKNLFAHVVSTYIVDHEGRLRGHFKTETESEELLAAAKQLISESNSSASKASIEIDGAWVRALPPNVVNLAAYMTIKNTGNKTDRLLAISSPLAESVEVHESVDDRGMTMMRPVKDLSIAKNDSVKIMPGGLHLMLSNINKSPKAGEVVALTLTFEHAGEVNILVPVQEQEQEQEQETMQGSHH